MKYPECDGKGLWFILGSFCGDVLYQICTKCDGTGEVQKLDDTDPLTDEEIDRLRWETP